MVRLRHVPARATHGSLSAVLAACLIGLSTGQAAAVRLCLHPSAVPFKRSDERTKNLERIVAEHFERASVEVVKSRKVRKLYRVIDERSGAIIDPATGMIDTARQTRFEDDLAHTMEKELGCSGFLLIALGQVYARYGGVSAVWDGQTQQVNSNGRVAAQAAVGLLAALGGVYVREQGWVPALSLYVRVTDLRFNDVAFRSGGIEAIADISLSRGRDLLPEDRWLRDPKRIEKAADLALGSGIELLRSKGRAPGDARSTFAWD